MLPPSVRVFVAVAPVDMRRSFDGLFEATQAVIRQDPFSGHLFVFRGKTGKRVKVLFWDRSGLCIYYKRLEKGVLTFPKTPPEDASIEIEAADLSLILEGIDLTDAKRRARYVPVFRA